MRLGNRQVTNFGEPYIIAELAANHNGNMELARRLIDDAKEAGCPCVKFQSWSKTSLWARVAYQDNPAFEKDIDRYAVTEDDLGKLAEYCRSVGIDMASTPFSKREVDFVVDVVRAPFIKIASMDLNNYPFLAYVATKRRPIVLSTGLGTLAEIDRAVETIEATGHRDIVILHCVANYPPKDENVNLNNIDMLRANYPEYPVGFSDHTLGTVVPLAAIAKGASVIEKHFTTDKALEGWDHAVSLTKAEMAELVTGGRRIVTALGTYRRVVTEDDRQMIPKLRRSIVAARPIKAGKTIEAADLDAKRPGSGIEPQYVNMIIGRTARRAFDADDIITLSDF